MSRRQLRRSLHSGPSGNPDHRSAGRRAVVGTMVMPGADIPPLHWWRRLPAAAFTTGHLAVIRRAIAGFGMIGEPNWPAAAAGFAPAAVAIALRDLRRHGKLNPSLDLTMSALLRCALSDNSAAALVLAHALVRLGEGDPSCAALAASWSSITLARWSDRKLEGA